MSLRLVARPAREARPAIGAVGAVRAARAEEVLGHRARPVGEVVGAVLQRGRDAVGAPRPAAMEAPAEEVEGAEVVVIVQEAAHPGGRARAPQGLARDVHLHLGEPGAARRRLEAPAGRARGDLGEPGAAADGELLAGGHAHEPQLSGNVAQFPVGVGPGAGGGLDPVQRGCGGHVAVRAVEEVAPQGGRLQAKRRPAPDGHRGGRVVRPPAHDKAIRGHVAQAVAPVGE